MHALRSALPPASHNLCNPPCVCIPSSAHRRFTADFMAGHFVDYEPGIHYPQAQMQAGTTGINTFRCGPRSPNQWLVHKKGGAGGNGHAIAQRCVTFKKSAVCA